MGGGWLKPSSSSSSTGAEGEEEEEEEEEDDEEVELSLIKGEGEHQSKLCYGAGERRTQAATDVLCRIFVCRLDASTRPEGETI